MCPIRTERTLLTLLKSCSKESCRERSGKKRPKIKVSPTKVSTIVTTAAAGSFSFFYDDSTNINKGSCCNENAFY